MTLRALPLLLALAGCEWVHLPVATGSTDADGDGYYGSDDCDDYNDNVHPFAAERCNGTDNNCSGDEDDAEDAATWYPDADADGFGDPGGARNACDPPLAYVSDGTDCDDTEDAVHPGADEPDCTDLADYNCDGIPAGGDVDRDGAPDCVDCAPGDPTVFPGAPELCNDRDDDCDGLADEDTRTIPWYLDADGDGWGTPGVTLEACSRPAGYSADATDCDDTDATTHPYAPETCDDSDEDCDGLVDEDVADPTPWYVDADGDGYGDDAGAVGSCDPVAGRVPDGGDCDDTDTAYHPGAEETCADAADYDCDGIFPTDDADRDGWAACEDCDDADASRAPDAEELCDGLDQDCDTDIDEDAADAPAWYADTDADGFGSGDPTHACTAPAGTVAAPGDCDEASTLVNPGMFEVCTTAYDDDCDGETNLGALDCVAWFHDEDADGYGDTSACLCEPADPYTTAEGGDCDESDPTVSPAASEVCADGVDNDCDGASLGCGVEGELTTADGQSVFGGAGDDAFGTSVLVLADDAGESTIFVGAYSAASGGADTGAVYRFSAASPPADALSADATWLGEGTGDTAGRALAAADLDGDGALDLVVGAPGDSTAATDAGAIFLVRGPLDIGGTLGAERWTGGLSSEYAGAALATLPDRDGDGIDELLVGARAERTRSPQAGAVYLLSELATGGGTLDADADTVLLGEARSDFFGAGVASGDLDGDGLADILVGAYLYGGGDAGAVYVFSGDVTGEIAAADADAIRYGNTASEVAGVHVAAGDTDGDGYADLVVAAPGHLGGGTMSGGVYIEPGPLTGATSLGSGGLLLGEGEDDGAGDGLAVGDLDADGRADVITAGEGVTHGETRVVWIAYGPVSGTQSLADAAGRVLGTAPRTGLGDAMALGGDIGGYPYLVLGAFQDDTTAREAGAITIFEGGPGL